MIKDKGPEDTEDVAHKEPKMSFERPDIFDQIVDDWDSNTSVDDGPDDKEHSRWSDPKMELVGGGFVAIGAFNLVADLDCDEHEWSEDSHNPLVLAGQTEGICCLCFNFLYELVVFDSGVH